MRAPSARAGTHRTRIATVVGLVAPVACAQQIGTRSRSELLPRPGARVEFGKVANATGRSLGVDAPVLLRAALEEALRDERIAAAPGAGGDRFVLDLAITDHRPGNAFRRWLVLFWESTLLAVRGTLREAGTGALAASTSHQRSVHVGGALTIGAWRTIIVSVAGDLAADLRVRAEHGDDFVVAVPPARRRTGGPDRERHRPASESRPRRRAEGRLRRRMGTCTSRVGCPSWSARP